MKSEIITLKVDASSANTEMTRFQQGLESIRDLSIEISDGFAALAEQISVCFEQATVKTLEYVHSLMSCESELSAFTTAINGMGADQSSPEQSAEGNTPAAQESVSGIIGEDFLTAVFDGAIAALVTLVAENAIPAIAKALEMGAGQFALLALAAVAALGIISAVWNEHGASIVEGVTTFVSSIGEELQFLKVGIIDPILQYWGDMCGHIWEVHLKPLWDNCKNLFSSLGEDISELWNVTLKPLLTWLTDVYGPLIVNLVTFISGIVDIAVGFIADIINGLVSFLSGIVSFVVNILTGQIAEAGSGIGTAIRGVFQVVAGVIKGVVNAILAMINAVLGAVYSVIAGIVNMVSGVIEFGGNLLGIECGNLRLPSKPFQIPYLAQGAVLPANRPFMAIVGDQRHGTNVEAPLATIQEAVALVMEDQTQAIVAGFNASIGVQREILGAVLGIRIGDDVIAHAVDRYNRKMAKMGGYY